MDVYVLYVLYGVVLMVEILRRLCSRRSIYERPADHLNDYPDVTVLVPLYNESLSSITCTLKSLRDQDYPRDKINVVLIVEPDDVNTIRNAEHAAAMFKDMNVRVVKNVHSGRKLKSRALNSALQSVDTNIVCIFDADNYVPPDYLRNAVSLIVKRGYAAVGTRVYRYRGGLLGALNLVESRIWHDTMQPLIYSVSRVCLLSGEGLTFRKDVMTSVPDGLAEDALMSLKLSGKGFPIALVDSYVIERAPRGLRSLIKQRIRWYRGSHQNLLLVLTSNEFNVTFKLKVLALYIIMSTSFMMIIVIPVITVLFLISAISDLQTSVSTSLALYAQVFALLLALVLLQAIDVASVNNALKDVKLDTNPLVIMISMPAYYILLAMCFIASMLIPVRSWLKTER